MVGGGSRRWLRQEQEQEQWQPIEFERWGEWVRGGGRGCLNLHSMLRHRLQAKAIQRLIGTLCGELRGVAVPLVDAFAIPDHILRAPIGLRYGRCCQQWH